MRIWKTAMSYFCLVSHCYDRIGYILIYIIYFLKWLKNKNNIYNALCAEKLLRKRLTDYSAYAVGIRWIKSSLDLGEKLIKKNIERKIENDMRRTGKQADQEMFSTFKKGEGNNPLFSFVTFYLTLFDSSMISSSKVWIIISISGVLTSFLLCFQSR